MRRYKAETYKEYYGHPNESFTEIRMVEDKEGDWVPYKNAHDALQMLCKRVKRLEKENKALKKI